MKRVRYAAALLGAGLLPLSQVVGVAPTQTAFANPNCGHSKHRWKWNSNNTWVGQINYGGASCVHSDSGYYVTTHPVTGLVMRTRGYIAGHLARQDSIGGEIVHPPSDSPGIFFPRTGIAPDGHVLNLYLDEVCEAVVQASDHSKVVKAPVCETTG